MVTSSLSLPDDLEPLVGGTTTVIFWSPSRSLLALNEDVGAPAVSSPISTSSLALAPFAPLFFESVFALAAAAARVVGGFSSSLSPEFPLLDRRERFSGIFDKLSSSEELRNYRQK